MADSRQEQIKEYDDTKQPTGSTLDIGRFIGRVETKLETIQEWQKKHDENFKDNVFQCIDEYLKNKDERSKKESKENSSLIVAWLSFFVAVCVAIFKN